MPDIRFLLKISRPRFWLYLFGPYIVGLAAGAASRDELISATILTFGIYFLFPANLLIYGVNDIFDFATDKLNPKKQDYEAMVRPEHHRTMLIAIFALNIPFITATGFLDLKSFLLMLGFLFFSIFYSAPPIRAKAKPLLDSMFNVLYIFPGLFGYALISNALPPMSIIAAAGLWTMAMHAYSAVPDIDADREAGVKTIAVLFGQRTTLIICLILYIASAALTYRYLGVVSIILGCVYTAMILLSLVYKDRSGVFSIYKYFPLLNAVSGFILFWFVALAKFY
jgi:lycopene elongase/hydratase (dihydrobisanhydrobacterioruberin-forming)